MPLGQSCWGYGTRMGLADFQKQKEIAKAGKATAGAVADTNELLAQLVAEQRRTNELLSQLLAKS